MKVLKLFFLALSVVLAFSTCTAANKVQVAEQDSLNLLAEFSLFYEYYKNKDYISAEKHGWNVIHRDPSNFMQYKPFRKMEDVLWYLYENTADNEKRAALTDTVLFLYDKAYAMDAKSSEYFLLKKAYVLEIWANAPVEKVIEAYETAFKAAPNADTFYKDRLGIIFAQNDDGHNGYKLKALDLYSRLSEAEPENEVWISRMNSLAENPQELASIRNQAWLLDKENLEKCWKYAETCLQIQEFDSALVPLEFLVKKAPEVINYWRRLASTYTKVGRTDKAISSYKTLIDLEPDNRENYFNIAIIYQKLDQLSVARSYLQKASKASAEPWDLPIFIEAQLYEQAARSCGFEFGDKCVYQLAVETYQKAANIDGSQSASARERVKALENSVPQQGDYFFRKFKSGDTIKIEGKCYDWINKSITVP
ncbi:MAG: hypothetical protein KJ799_08115 [Bacteroidetes bacterium]|nr:hypothetical protein [Bacteroidota bacterium]MBU2506674.1 hypothetical protein [Bacteroidota bacterium]